MLLLFRVEGLLGTAYERTCVVSVWGRAAELSNKLFQVGARPKP